MMMTFRDKVNNIAKIKDFYTFAEALEEYAIDGIASRSPVIQEGAKRELMEKLKEHLLTEFGPLAYKPGSYNYFIRSGGDALLPYTYSKLMDLSCLGNVDLVHVLELARKMKRDYEPADSGNIAEETVRNIMTWMDQKYSYSTRISSLLPMFLIMEEAPVGKGTGFLRENCEVTSYAFVFWKARNKTLITAPYETSFLLRLSDEIVKEAWLSADEEYLTVIDEELKLLEFDHISKINNTLQEHRLIAELVCIGIAIDSPFQQYIPFLGQSKEYLDATIRIADKLLAIIEEKRGF